VRKILKFGVLAILIMAGIASMNKNDNTTTPATVTPAVAAPAIPAAPVPTAAEQAAAKAEQEADNRTEGCLKLQAATDARHEPKKCTLAAIAKAFAGRKGKPMDEAEAAGLCVAAGTMIYNGNNKRNTIKKLPDDVRREIAVYCVMMTMGSSEKAATYIAKAFEPLP
jgi:hypothetical protein